MSKLVPSAGRVPLRIRVQRGVLWGWSVALAVTAFVALRLNLAGMSPSPAEEKVLARVVGTYWLIGTAVGVFAAFVLPYLKGRWRTVTLGFLAMLPLYVGAASAEGSPAPVLEVGLITVVISALVGPFAALMIRAITGTNSWPVSDRWP